VIVHDPLGNRPTNGVAGSNHEVKGQSKAMVARLVGITPNGVNSTRELGQDGLPTGNHMGLALVSWDFGAWPGIASSLAALKVGGAWALVCSKYILRLEY